MQRRQPASRRTADNSKSTHEAGKGPAAPLLIRAGRLAATVGLAVLAIAVLMVVLMIAALLLFGMGGI